MKSSAKAYVAGAIAFLASLTSMWAVGTEFTPYFIVASLGPALAAFAGVYWTPNEEAPNDEGGYGLVEILGAVLLVLLIVFIVQKI